VFETVRGAGLMLGLKCHVPCGEVQEAFAAEGLLSITAGDNTLRLVPPLVITDEDIATGMDMMRRGARRCRPSLARVAAK
jgi:acetylornithine/N-succinyldiaminopimelate aminotransferase